MAEYISWKSSKSSGFSFTLHQFEHIANSDGALDVSDEMSSIGLFTWDQGYFDLCDTSSRSGSAEKLCDSCLDWFSLHVSIVCVWKIILIFLSINLK